MVQPYVFALVYVGLGDRDQALDWLRRGVDEHSDEIVFIKVDPAWEPLRPDPRFKDLLREMGFGS